MIVFVGCLLALAPLVALLFCWPGTAREERVRAKLLPLLIFLLSAVVFLLLRELLGYGTILAPSVWRSAVRLRITLLTLVPVAFATTLILSKLLNLKNPGGMPLFLIRQGVVFLGLAYFYLALTVVTSRISYPFDLEWMEAAMLDGVRWLQAGNTLYVAPTKEFASLIYAPFFFRLQALLPVPETGSVYLHARWLSLCFTLGVMVCIYRLAIAWSPHVREAGILALAIFSISFAPIGYWWDMPRVDMLFVLLGLLGFHLCLDYRRSWWTLAGAAALFALSGYTKQPGLLFVLGAAAVMLIGGEEKKRVTFLIGGTVLASAVLWGAEAFFSKGMVWSYSLYMLGSPRFHPNTFLDRSFGYALLRTQVLWFVIVMILLVFGASMLSTLKEFSRNREILAATGLLLMSSFLTLGMLVNSGWNQDNIPMVVGLAIFLPALASFFMHVSPSAGDGLRSPLVWVYVAIGFFALTNAYYPVTLIPTASDLKAGNELVEYLRSKKGPVFVPSHPTFARLAGKPGHIHYISLLDWRRVGGDLPADLADAVRSREFAAVVLDGEDEFRGNLEHSSDLGDLIRANYMKDPSMTAWNGNDLIPVVGGKKRPRVFLIPRSDDQKKRGMDPR